MLLGMFLNQSCSLDCGGTVGQKATTFRPGLLGKEIIVDLHSHFLLSSS